MPKMFYITTAIDYTNSPPHIGHAYEKILADVITRYHRLKGDEVFFLTGVDQHGQKVQQFAEKEGIAPEEFVRQITEKFQALWQKLDVRYARWAATTDPLHKKCVQGMLQRLFDEGQIYKDKQAGYYSVRQEQFLTDKERGPDGEFGPEWGQVEFREEENYYFKLSEHKQWLLHFLKGHPDFVTPSFRQTELVNAVEKLSGDLCISRPKSRLDWGIELPFDRDFVNYVWFDALSNYISFIGYDPTIKDFAAQTEEFRKWWPALHVIGKDIMAPAHGIYWPIMLHALGFPDEQMPKLLVHGWWNISGAKMSKSLGNVVDPDVFADKYGAEALRYYLISDITTGKDADFSEERLVARYNADLANGVGNLLSRSLNMIDRYLAGRLTKSDSANKSLIECWFFANVIVYEERFDGGEHITPDGQRFLFPPFQAASAAELIMEGVSIADQLIEQSAPWKLAKDPSKISELRSILYDSVEALRIIAILISPVLPKAAHRIFDQLDPEKKLSRDFRLEDAEWGKLPDGHVVGKPTPLFPRIET